jgi:hypothetical protein
MRRFLKIAAVLLAILFVPSISRGTDNPIFPTGPIYRLTGLVWGTSTSPGFNNNYFFTPLYLNESVCVYIRNNNPTSAHSFTASIVVTSDPTSIAPSDLTSWQTTAIFYGNLLASGTQSPVSYSANVSGASQVSINLTASSTQAGSPDTANVTIIQTTGSCQASNNSVSSGIFSTASTTLQAVSDSTGQAYGGTLTVTNPVLNQLIGGWLPNTGNRSGYMDTVYITCSAACTISAQAVNNNGTTCTSNATTGPLRSNAPGNTSGIFLQSCATNPNSVYTLFTIDVPAAGTPFALDLRGIICPAFTTNGFILTTSAVTGTVRTSWKWYEK